MSNYAAPSVEDLAAYAREHLSTLTPSDPDYAATLKAVMDLERLSSTLQNEEVERWVKTSDQEIKTLDHASHRKVAEKPPVAPTVVSADRVQGPADGLPIHSVTPLPRPPRSPKGSQGVGVHTA